MSKRINLEVSLATREKLRNSALRRKHTPETIEKIRQANTGERNRQWKGGYKNTLLYAKNRKAMKKGAEGTHTLAQWEELKMQYGYMCLCCKEVEPDIVLTEDHIVPLIKGGSNYISNIQPLCGPCNSRKYTKIINYLELVC